MKRVNRLKPSATYHPYPPNNNSYVKTTSELYGKVIFTSCHNWLILRHLSSPKTFSLWDPGSLQAISLPPLPALNDDNGDITAGTLLSPCDHANLTAILFAENLAFSYRPANSDADWVVTKRGHLDETVMMEDVVASCNDDVVYARTGIAIHENGAVRISLAAIHLTNTSELKVRYLELKNPEPSFAYCYFRTHFVESCGRVYFVDLYWRIGADSKCEGIFMIKVWELDFGSMNWEEVKSLGDRVFFVGPLGSTWCWASTHEGGVNEGNRIFFVVPDDKTIYLYKLEDQSVTAFLPCSNLRSPWHSPTWVMPFYPRSHSSRQGEKRKHSVETEVLPKRLRLEKDNVMQNSFLVGELPEDIVALIPQHLHQFDYLDFRATCKQFRSVAPPLFRGRGNDYFSLPLLMSFENDDGLCRIMDPCRRGACYMTIPKSFGGIVSPAFAQDAFEVVF